MEIRRPAACEQAFNCGTIRLVNYGIFGVFAYAARSVDGKRARLWGEGGGSTHDLPAPLRAGGQKYNKTIPGQA